LTIRIEITAETPEQYQALIGALAGGARVEETLKAMLAGFLDATGEEQVAGQMTDEEARRVGALAPSIEPIVAAANRAINEQLQAEPAPQRKRRTKAEIEAARAAEAPPPLASQTVTRAISETPEERVGPTDAPEIEDEPKPEQPADAPLTHDNVRSALKAVVDAKGLPFATSLLTKLGFGKVSDIPADKFGEVIEQLKGAAA
jgi:hypothetical protein